MDKDSGPLAVWHFGCKMGKHRQNLHLAGFLEAQTFMNLFMKNVLSKFVVDEEEGRTLQLVTVLQLWGDGH